MRHYKRYVGTVAALLILGAGVAMAGHDARKSDSAAEAGKVELSQVKPLATPESSPAPVSGDRGEVAGDSEEPQAPVSYPVPSPAAALAASTPTPAPAATATPAPAPTIAPSPTPPPITGCGHCGPVGQPGLQPKIICPMYYCVE